MAGKLTKSEILKELIETLLKGWPKSEIFAAIENASGSEVNRGNAKQGSEAQAAEEPRATIFIDQLRLPIERKEALLNVAKAFDAGHLLPTQGDIKRFLEQRSISAKDIKGRNQAFRRMMPVLVRMSDKGVQKLLTQAHLSGPAELSDISEAIKSSGSSLRK